MNENFSGFLLAREEHNASFYFDKIADRCRVKNAQISPRVPAKKPSMSNITPQK